VAGLKRGGGGGISVYRGEETQSKYAQDSTGDNIKNMKSLDYGLIKFQFWLRRLNQGAQVRVNKYPSLNFEPKYYKSRARPRPDASVLTFKDNLLSCYI
jgi:hypothetical protein